MATISYTKTEQALINKEQYLKEIPTYELERFAEDIDRLEEDDFMYYAIELGRCPSTDCRTYILHTWSEFPRFDYYGAEKINRKILGL